MARNKRLPIEGSIPDWSTPWDNGTQAYTTAQVREFIREEIARLRNDIGEKVGAASFEGTDLKLYASADDPQPMQVISISGTSYIIDLHADCAQTFHVLTSQEEALITIAPTTHEVHLGAGDPQPYQEGYTYRVEVDSGNGYIDRTPAGSNTITEGGTASINIRDYLTTGANRVRLIVTGMESGQPKAMVFNVNLTSLNLSVDHSWHKAWIQGEDYSINGITFSGNISKVLRVRISGNGYLQEYRQTFAASAQYISAAYGFSLPEFPATGTGVYEVDVWMEGGDVSTRHYRYNIMCVAAGDISTAQLVCINDVPAQVANFTQATLFRYATYSVSEVALSVEANLGGTMHTVVPEQTMTVQTQTKCEYTTSFQIDTQLDSGLSLICALRGGGAEQTATMALDNSNAYLAESDKLVFYLNPGIRYNNRADRREIHNTAPGADIASYEAQWENFTFADDAWTTDPDGHKCLAVMAGSTLEIKPADPGTPLRQWLRPLATSNTESVSVEWMYRADNIADYDTPVFSIMSTEEFDQATTSGIVLFPTRLLVYDSESRNSVAQKLDFPEGRIIHIAVVIQRDYGQSGNNLCHIYVNGRENLTYQFTGSHAGTGNNFGYVRMGQPSTDFYLYMMRCYKGKVLESNAVLNNYINALIDTAEVSKAGERNDNGIFDSVISYDACRKRGFNCMVIESNEQLPDYAHNEASPTVTLRLEYAHNKDWDVIIRNIPIAGQGTTSMEYYRWNFTHKIKNSGTVWEYPNHLDGNPASETGKAGYIAGYGLHPKVAKITSKKNVASQSQGHKMGATAMYNDLFKLCVDKETNAERVLPTTDCRVAVYQYPFIGFQMRHDDATGEDTYEFIGLYTVGPDKKDKKTFCYDKTDDYPRVMMIEGPNHAPLMTRFLVPWTDEVFYIGNSVKKVGEKLYVGDRDGTRQEGWDAGIVGDYETDSPADEQNVMQLFRDEFRPAYDAVYFTSPYIYPLGQALTDAGIDPGADPVAALNANVTEFRKGITNGHKNELMTFYTSDYSLVYYRVSTGQYAILPKQGEYGHDMLAYLGLSGTPGLDEILAARAAKFADKDSGVFRYINKEAALFHEAFCELLGVSDNHAKNTYWVKYAAISEGGKWIFDQDDLDTIFQNDNNGNDTKPYSVEPDDLYGTDEIFQGANSAFWYQLRQCCRAGLRGMMGDIVEAMKSLAGTFRSKATDTPGKMLDVVEHYFWSQSAKYFPAMAYNEDTRYAYIDVWAKDPDRTYNSVPPLTQIHGDHYETERAWVERRIAYMLSKYNLGGFTASSPDGYGSMVFTSVNGYDMTVTPAIDLYPCYSPGGSGSAGSARVAAGEQHVFNISGGGATNTYIKGMDWLSDLGDLSGMNITNRTAGESAIIFDVSSKRLRRLIVGSDSPIDREQGFNADSLRVSGESMEYIFARNVSTIKGTIDLGGCPRLRRADFYGTGLTSVLPPVGGRVAELYLPDTITTLFLHSLNLLDEENLHIPEAAYGRIANLYFNKCEGINPIGLLIKVVNAPGSSLGFVTMIWEGEREITSAADFDTLADIVNNAYDSETGQGIGYIEYNPENGTMTPQRGTPRLEGTLRIDIPVYEDSVNDLQNALGESFHLVYDPDNAYIRFDSDEVLRVLLANNVGDGTGITKGMAAGVTTLPNFQGNTEITRFDELKYFTEVTTIGSNCFNGCTALQTVFFPSNVISFQSNAFQNTNLSEVHITNLANWIASTFSNEQANPLNGGHACLYLDGELVTDLRIPEGTTKIENYAFYKCKNEMQVTLPEGLQTIGYFSFGGCSNVTFNGLPGSVTTIRNNAFEYTKWNGPITIPAAVSLIHNISAFHGATGITSLTIESSGSIDAYYAFASSSITTLNITGGVTSIGSSAFNNCKSLTTVTLPNTIETLGGFLNCTALTTINIPSSVTSIGQNAFNGCSQLKVLIMRPTIPPELGANALNGTHADLCIYVPDESLQAYKTATGWSGYATKIHPMSDLPTE